MGTAPIVTQPFMIAVMPEQEIMNTQVKKFQGHDQIFAAGLVHGAAGA